MELSVELRDMMKRRVAPMAAYRRATAASASDTWLWSGILLALDVAQLVHLANEVRDPFPWRVFLRLVISLRAYGDTAELARAEAHLRDLARELLDLQGLALVEPDDLLASPAGSALARGLRALAGKEDAPE